jgi:hypothetical protein
MFVSLGGENLSIPRSSLHPHSNRFKRVLHLPGGDLLGYVYRYRSRRRGENLHLHQNLSILQRRRGTPVALPFSRKNRGKLHGAKVRN